MAPSNVNVLRKMSMKTLEVQDAAKEVRTTKQTIKLARVYGVANGVKQVQTDMGLANALIGQFEGQNLSTGAIYRSTKLYLAGGADETIIAALAGNEDSKGVQFAFEIAAQPDEKSSIGYRYQIVSLLKPADNDVLSSIRTALPGAEEKKQIEAPKTEAPKTTLAVDHKSTQPKEQSKQAGKK